MTHVYSDGRGEWDVPRLWALAAGLPVTEMDPEGFREWDQWGWDDPERLALRHVVEHMRRILAADMAYPVIVSAEGNVMDGCHRIARAALDGTNVRMVRFGVTPEPDRLDKSQPELRHED